METIKTQFDKEPLKQILDSFVELTDIRAAFFENYIELVNGHDKNICEFCKIIRKDPAVLAGCIKCDTAAYQAAKDSGQPYLYKCHIGLWEAVCPIPLRGSPTDYLMLGQVKCKEDEPMWPSIEEKLAGYGIATDQILLASQAYGAMESIAKSRLLAAVRMLHLITRYVVESRIINTKELEAVKKIKSYIDENFNKSISVKALSDLVLLSNSYLCHLFKKETGKTITAYTELIRIDHAKKLILDTKLHIKEIAYLSGFSDQNYFSRVFKKHTGQSPLAFRDKFNK